jgi:hypothetical protein
MNRRLLVALATLGLGCMSYPGHRIPEIDPPDLQPFEGLAIPYTATTAHRCPYHGSERVDCPTFQSQEADELAARVRMALHAARRVEPAAGSAGADACALAFEETELGNRWWPWGPYNALSVATLWIVPSYWRDHFHLRVALNRGEAVVWQGEYEEVVHLWMGWLPLLTGRAQDGDGEPKGRWLALKGLARVGAKEGAAEWVHRGCDASAGQAGVLLRHDLERAPLASAQRDQGE